VFLMIVLIQFLYDEPLFMKVMWLYFRFVKCVFNGYKQTIYSTKIYIVDP
jgi:hypothetical protein